MPRSPRPKTKTPAKTPAPAKASPKGTKATVTTKAVARARTSREPEAKSAKPVSKDPRVVKRVKKAKVVSVKPKRVRIPFAELSARKHLAERALDDIRNLMADADPIGAPADFAVRERKALALFDEVAALLPTAEPMTPAERARLEEELADKPDNETLRKLLLEMERFLDDPAFPAEYRDQVDREQIKDALASLDEVALLQPIARATEALANELRAPRVPDPKGAALRRETEKLAARQRS